MYTWNADENEFKHLYPRKNNEKKSLDNFKWL